ncbi:MAG: ATP-binding protein [Leptolyngbyaceae cyanobacterium bins.349]|nr:ATP-binding protein [Leptolyngbyaceae cyanobacterium bins.349]
MVAPAFIPEKLVGRQAELYQVSSVLAADGDLLIAGVPGSGRRRLVQEAAQFVGARIIEIDCLRATHHQRFLTLLAAGILSTFGTAPELTVIRQWLTHQPLTLETADQSPPRLTWPTATDEWQLFKTLLLLPQAIAEALNCRIVIVFQSFPHIRTWDRSEQWERYLRQEIQAQSRVSYALIATVAESWVQQSEMQVVLLGPVKREDLQPWLQHITTAQGLQLAPAAIDLFLDYIQGNVGDAIALLRRIWLDHAQHLPRSTTTASLQAHHLHSSTLALVEDLSLTFESLLLLLPSSQVRVLESLALDPTDSPHAREYIQKHHLSRGGGLQGALASLQQKGLVYGQDYGYRIAMPLLAVWLQQRLA